MDDHHKRSDFSTELQNILDGHLTRMSECSLVSDVTPHLDKDGFVYLDWCYGFILKNHSRRAFRNT